MDGAPRGRLRLLISVSVAKESHTSRPCEGSIQLYLIFHSVPLDLTLTEPLVRDTERVLSMYCLLSVIQNDDGDDPTINNLLRLFLSVRRVGGISVMSNSHMSHQTSPFFVHDKETNVLTLEREENTTSFPFCLFLLVETITPFR